MEYHIIQFTEQCVADVILRNNIIAEIRLKTIRREIEEEIRRQQNFENIVDDTEEQYHVRDDNKLCHELITEMATR